MPRATSPSSPPCVQPDHFYPTSPDSTKEPDPPGTLYDPDDDPTCTRGIPVFKPSMEEFADFEAYMTKVDVWGRRSGIVKVIPPAEWTASLPSTRPLIPEVVLKSPIEQRMEGGSGLFRQQNIERRKTMSVMNWARMCEKEGLKTPSPNRPSRRAPTRSNNDDARADDSGSDASSTTGPPTPPPFDMDMSQLTAEEAEFYSNFKPESYWLPPDTQPSDYTPDACRELERNFWRSCGIIKSAWYGADMSGSLFTDQTKTFNVAKLPSFLSRLTRGRPIAGVNTPYLYFGMWRATFAWHVEDMDLYSINYIHWGAPKFWYAIPSEKSKNFENVMRGYFPSDRTQCPEFLRHKSYLASPNLLAQSSCRPNVLVQHQGEFVITFPHGYHAGFNLGFNCAESTNFALESWIDLGRTAGVCACVPDSVSINVDALLQEAAQPPLPDSPGGTKRGWEDIEVPVAKPVKRMKTVSAAQAQGKPKPKAKSSTSTTPKALAASKINAPAPGMMVKIARKDKTSAFCCLCASTTPATAPAIKAQGHAYNLLRCVGAPGTGSTPHALSANTQEWWAHEVCARVLPETWVDEDLSSGEKLVYGIDCIVKERWHLKCSLCTQHTQKVVGAKIQCTKGKCPKAFHVTCAIENEEVAYEVTGMLNSDVLLVDSPTQSSSEFEPNGETVQPYKTVQKFAVSCLCPQHNPAVIEARKKQRQEKMKQTLHALPQLSRIRVRASSGVFEVTLISIDDQTQTVLVTWSDGEKRSIKWDNILWTSKVELEVDRLTIPARSVPSAAPSPVQPTTRPPSTIPSHSPPTSSYSSIKPTGVAIPNSIDYSRLAQTKSTPNSTHWSSLRPQSPPKSLAFPPYRPSISYQPFSQTAPPPVPHGYKMTSPSISPLQDTNQSPAVVDPSLTYNPHWQSANAWVMANFATPPSQLMPTPHFAPEMQSPSLLNSTVTPTYRSDSSNTPL